MKNKKKTLSFLKKKPFSKSLTYFDLIIILTVIFVTFSLRYYNTSDLSGGDDSQFAELTVYTLQDPIKFLYPSFPDEPVVWRNVHYSRPVTATVYAISTLIFGYNRFAMIFPPALFCTLSAILLYFILKSQFNQTLSLLATGFFVFSPYLLFFSRIGLLHSQLIFLSLLAYFLLFRYLKTRNIFYIYLSALCWLFNAWTTDIRGLVTAFAIIPIIWNELFIKNKSNPRKSLKKASSSDMR